jgi:hypothetical protein
MAWVLVLGLLSCAVAWYCEPFCGVLVGIIGRKWRERGEFIVLWGWGMGSTQWWGSLDRDLCGE